MGEHVSLVFSTVMDAVQRGLVDEDEEIAEVTDRAYWEKRGTKQTLAMTDEMLGWVRELDPDLELKYNKFYIGLAKDGRPHNFVTFRPQKDWVRLEIKVERSEETEVLLNKAGLDVMPYDQRWGSFRIRVSKADMAKSKELLTDLMRRARGDAE